MMEVTFQMWKQCKIHSSKAGGPKQLRTKLLDYNFNCVWLSVPNHHKCWSISDYFKGILENISFLLLWKENAIFSVAMFKHGSYSTLNFLFAFGDILRHFTLVSNASIGARTWKQCSLYKKVLSSKCNIKRRKLPS